MRKEIEKMIVKASEAKTAEDAQRWSQAACNAANAVRAMNGAATA